jgi:hypothetical protein
MSSDDDELAELRAQRRVAHGGAPATLSDLRDLQRRAAAQAAPPRALGAGDRPTAPSGRPPAGPAARRPADDDSDEVRAAGRRRTRPPPSCPLPRV